MPQDKSLRERTFDNFRGIMAHQHHVSIDEQKLDVLVEFLKEEARKQDFKPYGWYDYVSAEAGQGTPIDVARLVFEMALISGQQAGFIDADAHNTPRKWEINGSGAKAMVQKMAELRNAMGVPSIDFSSFSKDYQKQIARILGDDIPFKEDRISLIKEFTDAAAYRNLEEKVLQKYDAKTNKIVLDVEFLHDMASLFPENFYRDPFGKKACLALILSAANLKARGVEVDIDAWAASDYRLPQTLETLGVLEISQSLKEDLESQRLLHQDDMKVVGLRVASILVVEEICKRTGLPVDHVDFILWAAPRNEQLMRALGSEGKKPLPHMMVRTMRF